MAASDKRLGALHVALTEALITAMEGENFGVDDEGNPIIQPPSAALMAVASGFLKNNAITCSIEDSSAMQELEEKTAARRAKREKRKADRADLLAAEEHAGFMSGLSLN